MSELRLHHELLLLALCDRKGTQAFGQMVSLGLAGGIFAELVFDNRIRIVEEGARRKKAFVEVIDDTPTGDPAMDAALEKLASARRRASPSTAVSRIGSIRGLRQLIARDLCALGVLQESEREVLFLFRRRVYPTVDPEPEQALIERIRVALEGEPGAPVDERTAALIGLADVTKCLAAIYDRRELRSLRDPIRELRESSAGSDAAQQAVAAAMAAVMAAIAASAAAAAS